MQIRPTGLGQTHQVSFNEARASAAASQPTRTPVDQVELSFEAQMLARTGDTGRTDRVAQIRAEIAQGIYETPDKLDRAVSRLLDEIA